MISKNNLHSDKHQHLLNNLLDIRKGDPAIFFRVDEINRFDLAHQIDPQDSRKILENKNFQLDLDENNLKKLINEAKSSQKLTDLSQIYKKYRGRRRIAFEENFATEKTKLVQKLETKLQQRFKNWKLFQKNIQTKYADKGVWPLYIGTFLLACQVADKKIYAPLFLKKISIEVDSNQKVVIQNIDPEWSINEKMRFCLERYDLTIPDQLTTTTQSLHPKIMLWNEWAGTDLKLTHLTHHYRELKPEQIIWTHLKFYPGIVFGAINPLGTQLRAIMETIVNQNRIDKLLETKFNKQEYKNYVDNFINRNGRMIEIAPMNLQQRKAIISSLKHNTIIWGPPGTGKSQIITNLIANIMHRPNARALIVSEKKTALDILWDRLGRLRFFTFFISKRAYGREANTIKSEFYQSLRWFVQLIENTEAVDDQRSLTIAKKLLNSEEYQASRTFLQTVTPNRGRYDASLKVLQWFNSSKKLNQYHTALEKLNPNYRYPPAIQKITAPDKFITTVARFNKIKKYWLWYPRNFSVSTKQAFCLSSDVSKIDLNSLAACLKRTDWTTISNLLNQKDLLHPAQPKWVWQDTESALVRQISQSITNKIARWQKNAGRNNSKYHNYRQFAAAVRAGRLLPQTFLKKHETIISELFPIFVTTPENILQQWRTQNKPYFDYLIVDEASQMFVETGLALMSLATYKIIAGDDQQLQPSTWFSVRDQKREEERDTSEDADSLLNYAQEKGVYSVMLKKNYRSESAALMAFSSKHFYQSKLEVVDHAHHREKIPIKVINCKAGKWVDSKNEKEVDLVLEQCLKNLNRYPKIIILAFNKAQRDLIEAKIIDDYKYVPVIEKWDRGNLIIKNIENIQGDEADLVIMSLVYDATTHTAGTYVARKGGAHALNVAISRAKKKNIIIKSVTAKNIRPCRSKDFRVFQNWLKFLDLSASQQKSYCSNKAPVDLTAEISASSFKQAIIQTLSQKIRINRELPDINLVSNYRVGSLNLDLSFIQKNNARFILGIKIDGFYYHNLENYHQDKAQQNFLEKKGYCLYRVKEINWKVNRLVVIKEINQLLEKQINKVYKTPLKRS